MSVAIPKETSPAEATPPRPPLRRWPFLAGALTGAAGIATSNAATAVLGQETSPLVAVAEGVRDATPGSLAVSLVHFVKHLDKPLLVAGTTLGLLLVAGLAGVLYARRPWAAYVLLSAMAGLALWALLTRPDEGPWGFLPLLVGWGTWLAVIGWLVPAATRADRAALPAGRRGFLVRAGATVLATGVVLALGEWVGRSRRQVEDARALLRLPVTRGKVPSGAELDVSGVQPWRTPARAFYQVHTAITLPQVTPDEWQLRVHGMVDRPLSISYDSLVQRELTERWTTICCVSNPVGGDLVGNAYWSGVLVADLLEEAGVKAGADAVKQTSQDGWTCGTPLSALTDRDRQAMLVVAMNGRPLPVEHGFPVRMVVPGLYGYVSATKWLVDLEVTRFADFTAYWTERGWSAKGPVKTESRIDVPEDGGQVRAGRSGFGGVAWAQHTGIERVEYQLDGGPWQEAEIGSVPNDDTWVQWSGEAVLEKGRHHLRVRATDKSGYTQTSAQADVLPDGATGWHTIAFDAG